MYLRLEKKCNIVELIHIKLTFKDVVITQRQTGPCDLCDSQTIVS